MANKSFDKVSWLLGNPITNFCMSIVDDSVKANADLHYEAGMSPKIVRTTDGKCCEWCSELAGVYPYPDVPKDVYRRHQNCTCTVEYFPGDGKKQNVHSKQWSSTANDDIIKISKESLSLPPPTQLEFIAEIEHFPKLLGVYNTPKQLYDELINRGFVVKPLGKGKYRGIPFESGGGFRTNYRGDGILQFHPEKGSRHGGAYYKIGNAKHGIKRYTTRGDLVVKDPLK